MDAPIETYEHLLTALAQVSDAVITTNLNNQVVFMNAAAEAIVHSTLADSVGKPLANVLSIIDSISGKSLDASIDAGKRLVGRSLPRRAVVSDGAHTDIIIEYTVAPLQGAAGTLDGTIVVFRDMTRPASAPGVFEERERAQVTLNSIGDAVISTDFCGRVTFLNVIAEELTGWSQSDARGRPLEDVFALVDSTSRQPVLSPAMQAIIENEKVVPNAQKLLIRRDGAEIAVQDSTTPIHDERGGVVGAVVLAQDVTAARERADRLVKLALYDPLTGLPNRNLLADRLNQAIERAHRHQGSVALLFIDLDGFKLVNDNEGHATGDKLLQLVADRLASCVRSSDTVCRYGGDEFIVMLADILTADDAVACATKILNAINIPFQAGLANLRIGASIGIASYPLDARDPDALIKCADSAMYQAKADGRNNCHFYSQALHAPASVGCE